MRALATAPTTANSNQLIAVEPADKELSDRASLVKRASERTPTTAEGLVTGFYRADLLPNEFASESVDQLRQLQALKAAYVELSYEYGYPTLPAGEPFWHKLDYEPGLAYGAFQIFLDLGETSARELSQLADNQEYLAIVQSTQDHPILKTEVLQTLKEQYVIYYWRQRAKAYDLFKEAAYRHVRIQRQMKAEDHHYKLSGSLLAKVESYLVALDIKDLTPKTAIEALKAAVAIQRVSLGLPAAGPLPAKDAAEVTQFEAILRQLGVAQAGDSQASAPKERNTLLDNILKDPTTARQMQELVIRVTRTNFTAEEQRKGRVFDNRGNEEADDVAFHKDL